MFYAIISMRRLDEFPFFTSDIETFPLKLLVLAVTPVLPAMYSATSVADFLKDHEAGNIRTRFSVANYFGEGNVAYIRIDNKVKYSLNSERDRVSLYDTDPINAVTMETILCENQPINDQEIALDDIPQEGVFFSISFYYRRNWACLAAFDLKSNNPSKTKKEKAVPNGLFSPAFSG